MGYAWQQQRLGGGIKCFLLGVCGLIALVLLTQYGPYPTSLVGVPSQEISNTTPPKITLLALGMAQIGFLLSIEALMRRWLARGRVWTATVLVNGLIMPVFLWHSTVMMGLIGLCFWLLPMVLAAVPGSVEWWSLRPVWVLAFMLTMLVLLPLFLKLERSLTSTPRTAVSGIRLALASVAMSGGLALLAANGITGDGPFGLNWLACLLPVAGGFIALFRTPKFGREKLD